MLNIHHTVQGIAFEWNADKAFHNQIKHGVSFEMACDAFFDPFLTSLDDEMVDGEIRHTAVGMTTSWQILYIVYVWRGDTIRLISARPVTARERRIYETR
jgi:uncharacterized DUF497 family protein